MKGSSMGIAITTRGVRGCIRNRSSTIGRASSSSSSHGYSDETNTRRCRLLAVCTRNSQPAAAAIFLPTRPRTRLRPSWSRSAHNETIAADGILVRNFSSADNNNNNNNTAIDDGPVTSRLNELISEGGVQPDPHQFFAARELDRLYHDLMAAKKTEQAANETTTANNEGGFFSQFFGQSSNTTTDDAPDDGITGIYTYGGVGCGKTFLMELFFHALDNDDVWKDNKQIVHYHKFMLNVHQFMHTSRQEQKENHGNLDPVVDHILASGKLLCLDEFQVTDVADAMILKELFGKLWKKGCILVTTSNRPPRDLYLHGLQRDRFLPFVDLLEKKCGVVSLMDNETDYRMVISARDDDPNDDDHDGNDEHDPADDHAATMSSSSTTTTTARRRAKQVYFCGKDQQKVLQKLFYERAKGRPSNPSTLETQGRKVKIPMACKPKSICMFSFEELCQKALGAADYLVIGQQFSTVVVYGIPQMTVNEINWLRRFITFVDSMYEWKVRLLLQTNADSIEDIFRVENKESYQQDEVFAFDRTRSRLGEMSSTQYLSSQWLGGGAAVTTKLDLEPSVADQWLQLVGGNLLQDDPVTNSEEYYQKLFEDFDLNKDGVLDKHEIKAIMTKAFGYEPVDLVVNEMIASIDTDQNGVIDPKEFSTLLVEIQEHRQAQTE